METMNRTRSNVPPSLGITLSLALGFLTAAPAIAQLGVAERAGEALDNAGRSIRRGVENAIERGRAPIYDRQLLARVFGRIQWDKTLTGSTLDLEVRDEGIVILRGAVATPEAKDRAVLLARDTIGVTQVIDELSVLPPARVIPGDGAVPTPAPTTHAATIRVRPARVEPATGSAPVVKPARVVPAPPPSTGTGDDVIITP
jgi:hypothetical protein